MKNTMTIFIIMSILTIIATSFHIQSASAFLNPSFGNNSAPLIEEDCFNGIDDDNDGKIDSADTDC